MSLLCHGCKLIKTLCFSGNVMGTETCPMCFPVNVMGTEACPYCVLDVGLS